MCHECVECVKLTAFTVLLIYQTTAINSDPRTRLPVNNEIFVKCTRTPARINIGLTVASAVYGSHDRVGLVTVMYVVSCQDLVSRR